MKFSSILCGLAVFALFCGSTFAEKAKSTTGVRRALLVGVTEYADSRFGALKYTVEDVTALREKLLEMGFAEENICTLESNAGAAFRPTKRNILKYVAQIIKKSKTNDMIFVAFSGHGIENSPNMYFCAEDTEKNALSTTGVEINQLLDDLKLCEAKFKWVVIDACRNSTKGTSGGIHIADPPDGIALFQSCDNGETSAEDELSRRGLFTKQLLDALDGKADGNQNGELTFQEVCEYTTQQTKLASNRHQNPTIHLRGEFRDFVVREDLKRVEAEKNYANARKLRRLGGRMNLLQAKECITETLKDYPNDQKYLDERGIIQDYLKLEEKAQKAEEEAKRLANLPKPEPVIPSGGAEMPEGRQIAISNSTELDAALQDLEQKKTDNVVLVLAPGTYELSESYFIEGRHFSLYGNPQNPESVKIRFALGKRFSFWEGSCGSVIGCDITGKYGIWLRNSGTDFTLLHCRFHDCEWSGIWLSAGAHATVRDCDVADCGDRGITVYKSGTQLTLSDSRITGNKSYGVLVEGGTADVQNCDICNNRFIGVSVFSGGSGTFRNNRLSGNGKDWYIGSSASNAAGPVTRTDNTPNE